MVQLKNIMEGQCQTSPRLQGILTVLWCIFGQDLEILTLIGDELWHEEAQNCAIVICKGNLTKNVKISRTTKQYTS